MSHSIQLSENIKTMRCTKVVTVKLRRLSAQVMLVPYNQSL